MSYKKLKKAFDLTHQIPKDISQQWHMFKTIANHPSFSYEWYCELYFFPIEWMTEDKSSTDWIIWHHFLLQEAWALSSYVRNARSQDVIWDMFSSILSSKGYRPNPFHMDVLKHIISIALGGIPGIKAAGESEVGAPIKGLQEALIHYYQLKYIPTIMHPSPFLMDDPTVSPVYYSYHVPNLFTSLPVFRNQGSTLNELLELYELMYHFFEEVLSGHLKIEYTLIVDMIKKVNFTYFHSDVPNHYYNNKILHTREMHKEDTALLACSGEGTTLEFAEYSHFIRGCIRIAKK